MLRVSFVALLFAGSALAQNQSPVVAAACGPNSVAFAVKLDESRQTLAEPEPGKALIYFIQETGAGNCLGPCVTRIGLDGVWVGAFKRNSYFSVSVDPGEHHSCVNVQSGTALGKVVAFAHVSAEAGKVYYLGTQAFVRSSSMRLEMHPIDSAQAKHLIISLPLSVSEPKR
jgi:hypothetical protein